MRTSRILAAILLLAAAAGFGFYIYKKRGQEADNVSRWIVLSTLSKRELHAKVTGTGRLAAQDTVMVGSLVSGRVVELYVDDNDEVKEGQPMAKLDNGLGDLAVKAAEAVLREAEADLKLKELALKNREELAKVGGVGEEELEQARTQVEVLQARVKRLRAELDIKKREYENLTVKAPCDGLVIERNVSVGQMVTSMFNATVLFKVAKDLRKMELDIEVDESDVGRVKENQKLYFTVDSFPDRHYAAKISEVRYKYEVISGVVTYKAIAEVPNDDLTLRPGMTANVEITIAYKPGALAIPAKALRVKEEIIRKIADAAGWRVSDKKAKKGEHPHTLWVADTVGRVFEKRFVKVGIFDDEYAEILDGIEKNEEVVVEAYDPARKNPVLEMGHMKLS